jgi:hypothetical protein
MYVIDEVETDFWERERPTPNPQRRKKAQGPTEIEAE